MADIDYESTPPVPGGYGKGAGVPSGAWRAYKPSATANSNINMGYLEAAISHVSSLSKDLNSRLDQLRHLGSSLSVTDMLLLQYDSNKLNQLVEATSTLSAMLKDLAGTINRNVK